MLETVRVKKEDKNGDIYPVFMLTSWVMLLKVLQFCANVRKKSKYIQAIYTEAFERSCCKLSGNGFVY